MTAVDPKRWSENAADAPVELRDWLRSARSDLPTKEEMAALGIAFVPPNVPPASPPDAGGTEAAVGAKTTASGLLGVKGASILVVVISASGAWWLTADRSPPPPVIEQWGGMDPQSWSEALTESATPPEAAQVPSETTVLPPSKELPKPTPSTEARVPSRPHVAPKPPEKHAETSTAPSELGLLRNARRQLGGNPQQALALTREHQRLFPHGKYNQEREVIRIEALRKLGRAKEAERAGKDFEERYPGSAHRRKLEAP